jgi:hypothetical protein
MRTAAAVLTLALAQLAAAQSSAYGQVSPLPYGRFQDVNTWHSVVAQGKTRVPARRTTGVLNIVAQLERREDLHLRLRYARSSSLAFRVLTDDLQPARTRTVCPVRHSSRRSSRLPASVLLAVPPVLWRRMLELERTGLDAVPDHEPDHEPEWYTVEDDPDFDANQHRRLMPASELDAPPESAVAARRRAAVRLPPFRLAAPLLTPIAATGTSTTTVLTLFHKHELN